MRNLKFVFVIDRVGPGVSERELAEVCFNAVFSRLLRLL